MSPYSFHPDAFADLNDIWEFIALDSVDAADRVLDEVETAINMLVSNPHAGHLRPDLNSHTLRFWLVRNYLIAYSPEKPLLIHWHPARTSQSKNNGRYLARSKVTPIINGT